MHINARERHQVLELLYQALAAKPRAGWVNEYELKKLGDIEFTLVCLVKLDYAKKDGPNYQITGPGLLAYEAMQES